MSERSAYLSSSSRSIFVAFLDYRQIPRFSPIILEEYQRGFPTEGIDFSERNLYFARADVEEQQQTTSNERCLTVNPLEVMSRRR